MKGKKWKRGKREGFRRRRADKTDDDIHVGVVVEHDMDPSWKIIVYDNPELFEKSSEPVRFIYGKRNHTGGKCGYGIVARASSVKQKDAIELKYKGQYVFNPKAMEDYVRASYHTDVVRSQEYLESLSRKVQAGLSDNNTS
jgi:hypothetical protein